MRAANGDEGLFRRWHHKFTTALGQVKTECEEIVRRLAWEIDLGREMETVLNTLGRVWSSFRRSVSGYLEIPD